jgi:hypothetical protein
VNFKIDVIASLGEGLPRGISLLLPQDSKAADGHAPARSGTPDSSRLDTEPGNRVRFRQA